VGAFLLAEQIRMGGVPPYGEGLQAFAADFIDERDAGAMVTTHMYLLLGCAIPVWSFLRELSDAGPPGADMAAVLLSGSVIVGVGDTAASVVGKRYGRLRWPDSKKTVEGTAAAFLATILAVEGLVWLGGAGLGLNRPALVVAAFLACVLEAVTEQVDNLYLPVYFSSLLATSFSARGWCLAGC